MIIKRIGQSVAGRDISAFIVGSGEPRILCTAGIHAREFVTSHVLLKMVAYYESQKPDFEIAFIPYSNIDGTLLSRFSLDSINCFSRRKFLREINGGSSDFSLFKANLNGVDLNTNFPAHFGEGEKNVFFPSPQNYIGAYPLSEPENIAVAEFISHFKPQAALCFHSKGEVVYWKFHQTKNLERDKIIGEYIAKHLRFELLDDFSAGGLKDYLIQYLKIPAYTIELGSDNLPHPIALSNAARLFEGCKDIIFLLRSLYGKNMWQGNIDPFRQAKIDSNLR